MRKALIILAAAAAAASAWATDLNPGAGRAGATGNAGNWPWLVGLRRLWADGDPCPTISWVWDDYDDRYWNWHDDEGQACTYMVFEFQKPAGYDGGNLKWRGWGTSGLTTQVWRWRWSDGKWEELDSHAGTSFPTQPEQGEDPIPIPAGWFNADGYLYIMITCFTDASHHNEVTDRVDIQW